MREHKNWKENDENWHWVKKSCFRLAAYISMQKKKIKIKAEETERNEKSNDKILKNSTLSELFSHLHFIPLLMNNFRSAVHKHQ